MKKIKEKEGQISRDRQTDRQTDRQKECVCVRERGRLGERGKEDYGVEKNYVRGVSKISTQCQIVFIAIASEDCPSKKG